MTRVVNARKGFDKLYGVQHEPQTLAARESFPDFTLRVVVPFCLPPRHYLFADMLDQGLMDVTRVMTGEACLPEPLFVFPERWLSFHEQYYFLRALKANPAADRLRIVRLLTTNGVLLSGVERSQCRLVRWLQEEPYHPDRLARRWLRPAEKEAMLALQTHDGTGG